MTIHIGNVISHAFGKQQKATENDIFQSRITFHLREAGCLKRLFSPQDPCLISSEV